MEDVVDWDGGVKGQQSGHCREWVKEGGHRLLMLVVR